MKELKEDYRVLVRIFTDKFCIEDVLCKVFLPKRLTEQIELYFYPNEEQRRKLEGIFEFSIAGDVKGFSGEAEVKIEADKVYFKTRSKVYWGHDIAECTFTAEPINLKVTNFFHRDTNDSPQKTVGSFWLTPSSLLTPAKTIEPSYNGNVKVETIRQFKFTLANGFPLAFDEHFRYLKNEDGDVITFTELVAEFEMDTEKQGIENNIIDYLDDFLMLVSFAERRRCICLGWNFINSEGHTKYYRRNLSIPKVKEKQSLFETLIDIIDFEEFIKQAYKKFIEVEPKDQIRQAIQCVISVNNGNKTLENAFFTLYSALETLTLYFRKIQGLEVILPPEQWSQLRNDLEKWIQKHPLFSNNKDKRALVYEKIPELNRISFSTVFTQFCNNYSIDLNDLWPVIDKSEGISLSGIRNKLAHGDTFDLLQLGALTIAKEHLQWIVERLILAVLGWPISRSYINKDYLSQYMACYKDWEKDQEILSA